MTNKKQFILFAVCSAVLFAIMVAALFIADDFGEYTEISAQAVSLMAVTCAFLPWLDLPTALIKNDEGRHWGGFVSASPVSAKGQVASKYVLGFAVLVVIVNMLYFLLQICDIILYYSAGVTAMSGTISFALMLAFAVMLLWAVEIPFTVYFGSQTALPHGAPRRHEHRKGRICETPAPHTAFSASVHAHTAHGGPRNRRNFPALGKKPPTYGRGRLAEFPLAFRRKILY